MYAIICTFQDVTRLPVDPHSHLYEDVRDRGLYQDILASTLPSPPSLFDHRLPHQRNESRSKAYPQVSKSKPTYDKSSYVIYYLYYHYSVVKGTVYKGG